MHENISASIFTVKSQKWGHTEENLASWQHSVLKWQQKLTMVSDCRKRHSLFPF